MPCSHNFECCVMSFLSLTSWGKGNVIYRHCAQLCKYSQFTQAHNVWFTSATRMRTKWRNVNLYTSLSAEWTFESVRNKSLWILGIARMFDHCVWYVYRFKQILLLCICFPCVFSNFLLKIVVASTFHGRLWLLVKLIRDIKIPIHMTLSANMICFALHAIKYMIPTKLGKSRLILLPALGKPLETTLPRILSPRPFQLTQKFAHQNRKCWEIEISNIFWMTLCFYFLMNKSIRFTS